ncbi:MAG: signal peptidase I [Bdellovibrionales bacterium]
MSTLKSEEFLVTLKRIARVYAEIIILAVLLAVFLRAFVVSIYKVPTVSMAPTFLVGDVLVGYKLPFSKFVSDRLAKIKRGDVLVFNCPGNGEKSCLGRVIGLPGDRILVHSGQLTINGKELNYSKGEPLGPEWQSQPNIENFKEFVESDIDGAERRILINSTSTLEPQQHVVPEGELFFLSDYRQSGQDSMTWGTIPANHVAARVLGVLLSFDWGVRGENVDWVPGIRWERVFKSI